jgi:type I restriction enzyme, S subunit
VKIKEVPFSWIPRWGYRLDVGPFVGGAVETRVYLEKAPYPKEALVSLTSGYNGGIYNGPMFRRSYVESPEYGVPFLGSSEMLRADFTGIGYLRRRDAESPRLSYLRLTQGTTLISCSGTIGRTVYVRPDMEGMWTSQHIMKRYVKD